MTSDTLAGAGPGAASTGTINNAREGDCAAITAAALILSHTRGLRNHAITLRRAARPRRGREWLVRYNWGPEFAVTARQLRKVIRFQWAMTNAIRDKYDLFEVIDLMNYDVAWPQWLDAMMAEIGGGAS